MKEFLNKIDIDGNLVEENLNHFPTVQEIYNACKVNLEDFGESCALIAYKTSNNQEVVNSWPFWQFNNFLTYLNRILEKENGGEKNGENQENPTSNAHKSMQDMMGSAKSMMKGISPKAPKLGSYSSMPKF